MMQIKYDEFVAYRQHANSIAPELIVFVNDVAYFIPWWYQWNVAGGVSCHDNYPIQGEVHPTVAPIAESISIATAINDEAKPVWLIPPAFEAQNSTFHWKYPTPAQLRACVYTGLIHGATGIHYFTQDSWVSRDGGVYGMSPDPQPVYNPADPNPATPELLAASQAVWAAAVQINIEIESLKEPLLSPTADVNYWVDVSGQGVTDEPIRCIMKPHPEGGYALITVNMDNATLGATYNLPFELRSVERLFESLPPINLPPGTTSFLDTYEPFAVHVYHINGLTLSAILQAMDSKPGDLNWNPDADLDGDNEITTTDLSVFLKNLD